MLIESTIKALGEKGVFAEKNPNFVVRQSQKEMASAVANALHEKSALVVEAGTGTGKTFAYLVPALLKIQQAESLKEKNKIIISTATKNLQDQLFYRDLPQVISVLDVEVKAVLLKGRANYVCPYRLHLYNEQSDFFSFGQQKEIQAIRQWAKQTTSGEISECAAVPEHSPIWRSATSTADNCLGQDCPELSNCPIYKVRQQAMAADLVVVNHHLFFADAVLKEDAFGELLPKADAVIFDEAHQLPAIATLFYGQKITSGQIAELIRDVQAELLENTTGSEALLKCLEQLGEALDAFQQRIGLEEVRGIWQRIAVRLKSVVHPLSVFLVELTELLALEQTRSRGLAQCWKRSEELSKLFLQFVAETESNHLNQVRWYEQQGSYFSLQLTPLSVATTFQQTQQAQTAAWIFTSATLAVNQGFAHFTDTLGLTPAKTLQLDSPFDYQKQSLLYVPRYLPDPKDSEYISALLATVLPIVQSNPGGSFLLFTSHKALQEAAVWLRQRYHEKPLLVQGELNKHALLENFRAAPSVLLGTASFWEGVDVSGDALSCVVIDRLPFESPTDPILQAKTQAYRQQGKDAFKLLQLPRAVIALKQGAGRLIRSETDRGILVIGDPRLVSKAYGQDFLTSLPAFPRTRDADVAKNFWSN